MGNPFKEGDDAIAAETDEELKGYLDDVLRVDPKRVSRDFPSMADQEVINSLIAYTDKATSKAELIQKWRQAGALLTKEGMAVAKTTFKIGKSVFL